MIGQFNSNEITMTSVTTEQTAKAAGGAGTRIKVTDIIVHNSSDTPTSLQLLDGSGGTVKARISAPEKSGGHIRLTTPLLLTANTALIIKATDSVASLYASIAGEVVRA